MNHDSIRDMARYVNHGRLTGSSLGVYIRSLASYGDRDVSQFDKGCDTEGEAEAYDPITFEPLEHNYVSIYHESAMYGHEHPKCSNLSSLLSWLGSKRTRLIRLPNPHILVNRRDTMAILRRRDVQRLCTFDTGTTEGGVRVFGVREYIPPWLLNDGSGRYPFDQITVQVDRRTAYRVNRFELVSEIRHHTTRDPFERYRSRVVPGHFLTNRQRRHAASQSTSIDHLANSSLTRFQVRRNMLY